MEGTGFDNQVMQTFEVEVIDPLIIAQAPNS